MPKRIDLAAQRRSIATAAIQIVGDAGLEGVRLRDVARAANVTTGAVTHYFDSKDEVLVAALEEVVRRTLERIDAARALRQEDGADALAARLALHLPLDEAGRHEWRVWLAFWGRAVGDARLRAIHGAHYAQFVERLAGTLRALRPATPEPGLRRCADALIGAVDGIGTRATLEPESWPAERQTETLAALIRPMLDGFAEGRGNDA